jgi:hypothetical protein
MFGKDVYEVTEAEKININVTKSNIQFCFYVILPFSCQKRFLDHAASFDLSDIPNILKIASKNCIFSKD